MQFFLIHILPPQDLLPGFTSLYVPTPYASTMFWKPEVNLLVLMSVGGVSLLGIRLTKEGNVAPLFLCNEKYDQL